MSNLLSCPYCSNPFLLSNDRCPHCGEFWGFGNVRAAEEKAEQQALLRRYDKAKKEAVGRGAGLAVDEFEAEITAKSIAVIARPASEVQRLATSDNEVYATYYQLIEARVKIPKGEKWDVLRAVADSALFPNYKENIRFAVLCFGGDGLANYGECSLRLRTFMIQRRASVFEENSVLFMAHQNIKMSRADNLPKGYRAVWDERGKLCVAKLAGKIQPTTLASEYEGILMTPGATSAEDDFVEVHIWGPLTARTIEEVKISPSLKSKQRNTILKAVKHKLSLLGVKVS
jgi:hypothetical protein